ncbi:hypothetical protein [Hydrogenimonas sp.]
MREMWINLLLILAGSVAGTYLATELAKRYETLRFQKVLECTLRIETFMEKRLDARGEGLHAKINNVVYRLDREEILLLRRIATMRNRLLQENAAKIHPAEFDDLCKRVRKLFRTKYGRTF